MALTPASTVRSSSSVESEMSPSSLGSSASTRALCLGGRENDGLRLLLTIEEGLGARLQGGQLFEVKMQVHQNLLGASLPLSTTPGTLKFLQASRPSADPAGPPGSEAETFTFRPEPSLTAHPPSGESARGALRRRSRRRRTARAPERRAHPD